ncbi:hypothetical protein ISN44_As07g013080 [Arabidopsis suecica]|uniref:Uncharacterized protein n=1 Tax=Arabidopsis suecica TaxID=45249 RepID=A0A8T2C057_ARASU|nr:hypothetical protein ISN44_As07g013080 [Arabidopsis suecica]
MELYNDPTTRAKQFGASSSYIADAAYSLQEKTTANVAFVAISETDRVVSHATPPGMVNTLSRHGYARREPVSRYRVAEKDHDLTEQGVNELMLLEQQAQKAIVTIVEEQVRHHED